MRTISLLLVFLIAACNAATPAVAVDASTRVDVPVNSAGDADDDDAPTAPPADVVAAEDVVVATDTEAPGLDLAMLAGTWRGMASDSITATLTFGAPPSRALTAVLVQPQRQNPPCVSTFRMQGEFIYSAPDSLAPMFDNRGTRDVAECADSNENVMGGVVTSDQRRGIEGVLGYTVTALTATTLTVRHSSGETLSYTRQ